MIGCGGFTGTATNRQMAPNKCVVSENWRTEIYYKLKIKTSVLSKIKKERSFKSNADCVVVFVNFIPYLDIYLLSQRYSWQLPAVCAYRGLKWKSLNASKQRSPLAFTPSTCNMYLYKCTRCIKSIPIVIRLASVRFSIVIIWTLKHRLQMLFMNNMCKLGFRFDITLNTYTCHITFFGLHTRYVFCHSSLFSFT